MFIIAIGLFVLSQVLFVSYKNKHDRYMNELLDNAANVLQSLEIRIATLEKSMLVQGELVQSTEIQGNPSTNGVFSEPGG